MVEGDEIFRVGTSGALLLDAVRRAGVIARSDLTAATPLSQQSVHRLSEDLLARGFLRSEAPKISGRGKPSPRLALKPDGAFGLGLSIDTDSVHLALTNLLGEVLDHRFLDVAPDDPDAVRAATGVACNDLIAREGIARDRIAGLGISMQGFRATRRAVFMTPELLNTWARLDAEEVFQDLIPGVPVMAENNATLGAVAELWVGAGRRFDNFAYLSVNYGFGGGIVLNGAPYLGHNLNAAEVSTTYTDEETPSRPALTVLLRILREDGIDIANVQELRDRYDPDWPAIDRFIETVTPSLNLMIRALTGILDPAAVVFGGEAPVDLRRRLVAAVEPRRLDRLGRKVPEPEMLISDIEVNPSVLGAALLPIRRRLFQ